MRRTLLIAAATSALVLPVAGATAVAAPTAPPVAHIACKQARIAGESNCIARGQFCRHNARAMRDYARYGLRCARQDANGRWHLT